MRSKKRWPRQSDNLIKAMPANTPQHFRTIHHLKSTKLSPEIQTSVAVRPAPTHIKQNRRQEQLGTSPVIGRLFYTFYARPTRQSAAPQTRARRGKKRTENPRNKQLSWPPNEGLISYLSLGLTLEHTCSGVFHNALAHLFPPHKLIG